MDLFLDTAHVEEVKDLVATGLVDGVTTNPTLIARTGLPFEETILRLCQAQPGPVSAEVTANDWEGMFKQGMALSKIADNVVVKVPLTKEGLRACRALANEEVDVNVTLCFSAPQALLAAKAGAAYISPFIGRLDDSGWEGISLIKDIRQIFDNYGFQTYILAASIRHPQHVLAAAKAGADACTMPAAIFSQMFNHPMTTIGLEIFQRDWEAHQKG